MTQVMHKAEKVLIVIDDLQEKSVLAAVAAIQGYVVAAHAKHKSWCRMANAQSSLNLDLTVALPPDVIDAGFLPVFESLAPANYQSSNGFVPTLSDYDAVFDMSESRARAFMHGNTRQLAQLMGILIGGENDSLPTGVENLVPVYTKQSVVATSTRFVFDCCNQGFYIFSGLLWQPHTALLLQKRIQRVFEARAIVDYAGFETYLACALKKPVIEINDDPLLAKWSNPNYYMLTELDPKGLRKALRLCQLE